jgi:hypothetical protein
METLLTIITSIILLATAFISWINIREAPSDFSGDLGTNERYAQRPIHVEKYLQGTLVTPTESELYSELELKEKRLRQKLIKMYTQHIISSFPEEITIKLNRFDNNLITGMLESSPTPELFLDSVLSKAEYEQIITAHRDKLEQIRNEFFELKKIVND